MKTVECYRNHKTCNGDFCRFDLNFITLYSIERPKGSEIRQKVVQTFTVKANAHADEILAAARAKRTPATHFHVENKADGRWFAGSID